MQFFILVLLTCLFIFLYCVHVLSNDDFIFLRRDVTMEKLFNMVFIGSLISLFGARLFYGFSAHDIFSNLLVFILIPYFPGLSLLGGVVGGSLYLLSLVRRKDNQLPLGRIYDFFSIAFLISLPVGFIGYLMFSDKDAPIIALGAQAAAYFILFIIFLKFLLPQLLSGKFKEGTIAFLFLICFSVISLTVSAFSGINIMDYFKKFENIILILIFAASAAMLVRHENLLSKMRQLRKGR